MKAVRFLGTPTVRMVLAWLLPIPVCVLQWIFWDAIQPFVWFLFFPVAFVAPFIGGLWGGIGATLVSVVLVWYFFIAPQLSFGLEKFSSPFATLVFIASGIAFSLFQRRLRGSEREYRALFDNAAIGIIYIDATGHYVDANARYCEMLGRTRGEVIGHHLGEMTVGITPQFFADVGVQLARTGTATFERQLRNKDGSLLPVEVTVAPLSRQHRMAVVRDITERKDAEAALRKSEEKWRSVFELLPVGLSIVDPDNRVTDTNAALSRILQLPEEGIRQGAYMGRRYLRADHSVMAPEEFPSVRAVNEQTSIRNVEIGIEIEDGSIIWTSVSAAPLFAGTGSATVTVDITERKRAEESLRVSEARLAAVIENTRDGIWSIDRTYRLLVTNSVFRHNVEAQLGRELVLGESVLETFAPSIREVWQGQYDRALGGETFVYEVGSIVRPGGIVEVQLNPIRDASGAVMGVAARSSDITERVRAQESLRHAHDQLKLASDAAEIGIWTWDFEREQVEWDERLSAIYEVPAEIRQSGRYYDFWRTRLHPEDLEETERSLWAARERGEAWGGEFRIVLPSGQIRYVQSACIVEHDHTGKALRMVGVNRDITQQKVYEQYLSDAAAVLELRVAERTAELAAALEELKRAGRLKDEFLSAVSHELRTPLTGVLSMSEVLQMQYAGPLNERQVKYVRLIRESGERLLALVNSILRYTSLVSGRVQFKQGLCALGEVCEAALRAIREPAAKKGQTVTLTVEPPGLTIESDSDGIAQVLQVLLDNAVKFTPEGGRIGLEVRHDAEQAHVQMVVWDTGIGIAEEQQATIFQPFVQADASLARRFEGVGLGLAIARRTVELLGGTIGVESVVGEGSRFVVTLPLRGGAGSAF